MPSRAYQRPARVGKSGTGASILRVAQFGVRQPRGSIDGDVQGVGAESPGPPDLGEVSVDPMPGGSAAGQRLEIQESRGAGDLIAPHPLVHGARAHVQRGGDQRDGFAIFQDAPDDLASSPDGESCILMGVH